MKFIDEEELDAWYSEQKEIIDEQFSKQLLSNMDGMPKEKAKYEAAHKSLMGRYQLECEKLVERQKNFKTPEALQKEKDRRKEDFKRRVEDIKIKLGNFFFRLTYRRK